jgi:photosynthetic reaction center cytochrome c subunit
MQKQILAAAVALGAVAFAPQSVRAQAADAKTAEQVFKNITQLTGTPADQLTPAMQFIASSLGVECGFCHVQGKMEADDKPPKKTARAMMAMTATINKTSFGGRQQITCNSCHHGSTHPANMPDVLESDAPMHTEAAAPPAAAATATVDEILAKFADALGGADAIRKVTSRVMKGVIVTGGQQTPIELYTKAPNMRVSISHMGSADSFTAFDGTAGWMGSTGRPAREMSAAESGAAGLDAEFYLALRLREIYPQLRRARPEEIRGVECEVLNASAPDHPAVRLYFEKTTGLLLRMVRYADTPMGRMPTEIDYADYRDAGGAKAAYRWTLSRPNGRFTIQISEMKANVAIDDARFRKPAGEVK